MEHPLPMFRMFDQRDLDLMVTPYKFSFIFIVIICKPCMISLLPLVHKAFNLKCTIHPPSSRARHDLYKSYISMRREINFCLPSLCFAGSRKPFDWHHQGGHCEKSINTLPMGHSAYLECGVLCQSNHSSSAFA